MKRRIFTEDGAQIMPNMQADQPGRKRFASEEERLKHLNMIRNQSRKRYHKPLSMNFDEKDVICRFDFS